MGNSVLMMDAEGLHALANTLEGRAGSFDSLISTFDSNTNSITDASVWSGDDSVAFNGAAKEFKEGDYYLDLPFGTFEEVEIVPFTFGDGIKTEEDIAKEICTFFVIIYIKINIQKTKPA